MALPNMKWAADLSCYKTATSRLAKCTTRCVKHLAPASSRTCPGIGCGIVGVVADRVYAVLYHGGGGSKAGKALKTKGIIRGGARPTVRKHGMYGHQNLAAARDQPRLLDQVRGVIRRLHYSIRTEQTYVDWIRRFILYLPKALHPCNPGSSCSTESGIRRRWVRPKSRRF
jgi:hypothetical protein